MRQNNFDIVRLVLAVAVFFSHSFPIAAKPSLYNISVWSNAAIAVQCFFVVSGFLIFSSYHQSASLSDYIRKRACRIFPAYFAVVIICALGGSLFSSLPLQDYFGRELSTYLITNLTFLNYLHPTLPGVFDSNPIPVINGALWTIKVELMFYVSVPLISVLFKYAPKYVVLAVLYVAGLVFRKLCEATGHVSLAVQLPGQLQYFMSGALLYFYNARFKEYANRLIVPAILIAALEIYLGTRVLFPLCLAFITIYLALCAPVFNRFRPRWDLSYGFYLWHFPLLQVVTFMGWFRSPALGLLASGAITGLASVISWTALERWFIKRSRKHPLTPNPATRTI